ncbi:TetR/AcrR family transcriptional regulator [Nocardia callitridis]|uniref:TetR/AcrR family transcriptional regulator n=1 Tax=Nocardia callitridis TaxID=648753 RepID=A0ABP9JTE7_9NOCA
MPRHKEFDADAAVDKAMQVFWTHGYANTTPQRLVDELGIGRGSLYNAFGSKRELYERALRRYYERETARLIEVLDGPGDARGRLRAALRVVIAASLGDRDRRGCLMTNAAIELTADDELVAHLVRRAFDRQHAAFFSTVAEGVAMKEFGAETDCAAVASLLLATINGIRVLARVDPSPARLDALADTALRVL